MWASRVSGHSRAGIGRSMWFPCAFLPTVFVLAYAGREPLAGGPRPDLVGVLPSPSGAFAPDLCPGARPVSGSCDACLSPLPIGVLALVFPPFRQIDRFHLLHVLPSLFDRHGIACGHLAPSVTFPNETIRKPSATF